MAGYREDEAKKALGFPEGYRVVVLFALGYEGDAKSIWDKLEERVKERLAEQRKRKPRHENFFLGAFGGSETENTSGPVPT